MELCFWLSIYVVKLIVVKCMDILYYNDILSILFMILVEKEYDLLTVYQNRHSPSPKDNASNQFMINLYTCTKDSKCSNGYL